MVGWKGRWWVGKGNADMERGIVGWKGDGGMEVEW
jgi:hypothetical protein